MLSEGTTNNYSYHIKKGDEFHPLFYCHIFNGNKNYLKYINQKSFVRNCSVMFKVGRIKEVGTGFEPV